MAGEDYNEKMRRDAIVARNAETARNAAVKQAREDLQAQRRAARAEKTATKALEAGDTRRAVQRIQDQKVIDANEERRKSIQAKRAGVKKTNDALKDVDKDKKKQLKNIKKLPPAERKKATKDINTAANKSKRNIKKGK